MNRPENREWIVASGVRVHNLKNVSLRIPKRKLVVFTGPSGSGKSSLAFDTLFAEGQRRYVESMSVYARQFLTQVQKPDYDELIGLSPTISIEQKSAIHNPRSTVGTTTEVLDHLRLLWARLGQQWCVCGLGPVGGARPVDVVGALMALPERTRFAIAAPLVRNRKGEFRELFEKLRARGFARVRVDGEMRELADLDRLKKTFKHDIDVIVDRLVARAGIETRLAEAVDRALIEGEGRVLALLNEGLPEQTEKLFSTDRACECGRSYPELTHQSFSFNSPLGQCPDCKGLGVVVKAAAERVVGDPALSIADGALLPFVDPEGPDEAKRARMLTAWCTVVGVDMRVPWRDLPPATQTAILLGDVAAGLEVRKLSARWEGVLPWLDNRLERGLIDAESTFMAFFRELTCPGCSGDRLRPESRVVRFFDHTLPEVSRCSIDQTLGFFEQVSLTGRDADIGTELVAEIRSRLRFLTDVGVGYLSLNRASPTLSGGEAQRIRLAAQLGSELTGVLYVLDEPSIGLHQRDNHRLIRTLEGLRDRGNSVLVVEHDRDTMEAADWLVDFGPGAGVGGGEVVWSGPGSEAAHAVGTITSDYLGGRRSIPYRAQRRAPGRGDVVVRGARANNLKNIDVAFGIGMFNCVTGVSGSGKSTLVNDILYAAIASHLHTERGDIGAHDAIEGLENIDKIIRIDQAPIGRTPRSNPATYTKVFDEIRTAFAGLPDAKIYGYGPGRFSFNVAGGRCEACLGAGVRKIEMSFLADVHVECETCRGRRFNEATLRVKYRGRSVADVLDMPIEESAQLFEAHPKIRRRLQTLLDVGLGYLTLGQSSTTLSGGEAQRIKLTRELSKVATGGTLYVLDEPSTGLHFDDIRKLLQVIDMLVDAGNTVVMIEHNLEIIRAADRVIDLGPEGGDGGGRVVASGSPEAVAAVAESHTGRFLARELGRPA